MLGYLAVAAIGAAIGIVAGDLVFSDFKPRLGAQLYFYTKALGGGVIGMWIWALVKRRQV